MPRITRCKVCTSPYVDEINKRILRGDSYKEIYEWCKSKGCNFSYVTLTKHANNHVLKIAKLDEAREYRTSERLKKEIDLDVKILRSLRETLELLSKQLDQLKNHQDDPDYRKEIREVIGKLLGVLELFMRFKDRFSLIDKDKEIDLQKRIMYALQEFPIEYVRRFWYRWNEYGSRGRD